MWTAKTDQTGHPSVFTRCILLVLLCSDSLFKSDLDKMSHVMGKPVFRVMQPGFTQTILFSGTDKEGIW